MIEGVSRLLGIALQPPTAVPSTQLENSLEEEKHYAEQAEEQQR
jgi:hypothetical protein